MIDRIYVDTREHPQAIGGILAAFRREGVAVHRCKLDEGDYMTDPNARLTIDRKQNLCEVCQNVTWQAARFKREMERAMVRGRRMVILVEHGEGINTLRDVLGWVNPRLADSPKAVSGARLYRIMQAYTARYGITWLFCDKADTGREIMRILEDYSREVSICQTE